MSRARTYAVPAICRAAAPVRGGWCQRNRDPLSADATDCSTTTYGPFELPPGQVPSRADWDRLADRLRAVLTERIDAMFDLIDELGRDLAVRGRG